MNQTEKFCLNNELNEYLWTKIYENLNKNNELDEFN